MDKQFLFNDLSEKWLHTRIFIDIWHSNKRINVKSFENALLVVYNAYLILRDKHRVQVFISDSCCERVAANAIHVVISHTDPHIFLYKVAAQLSGAERSLCSRQRNILSSLRYSLIIVIVENAVGVSFGLLRKYPSILRPSIKQRTKLLGWLTKINIRDV